MAGNKKIKATLTEIPSQPIWLVDIDYRKKYSVFSLQNVFRSKILKFKDYER